MTYFTRIIANRLLEQIIRNTVRYTIREHDRDYPADLKDLEKKAIRNANRTIVRNERRMFIDY